MLNKNTAKNKLHHGDAIASSKALSSLLPFRTHLNSEIIGTEDSSVFAIIKLEGINHETVDLDELNIKADQRNIYWRLISDPTVAIHHTILRKETVAQIGEGYNSDFAKNLHGEYNKLINAGDLLENTHYLTVIVRQPLAKVLKLSEFFSNKNKTESGALLKRRMLLLQKTCSNLKILFEEYSPKILTTYEKNDTTYSEPLQFLSYLVNGVWREEPLINETLHTLIPQSRLTVGQSNCRLAHPKRTQYFSSVKIRQYPSSLKASALNGLLTGNNRLIITHSFSFVGRDDSMEELKDKMIKKGLADSDGIDSGETIKDALKGVATNKYVYGDSWFNVTVYDDTEKGLTTAVEETEQHLANVSLVPVVDDLIIESSYLAQMPTNWKYRVRNAPLNSDNYAHLSSFYSYPKGKKKAHWGEALTAFKTDSGAPYNFNLHVDDVGNTTIVGPTGYGKTVLMCFLATALEKYNTGIVYFDKDRGAEITIRAMGGQYRQIKVGVHTGWNPCRLPDTAPNRSFLTSLIKLLVSGKESLDAHQESIVESLVKANYDFDENLRKLSNLRDLIPKNTHQDLYYRLNKWIGDGEHAWLFDNADDIVDFEHQILAYDLTEILDNDEIRAPALRYMVMNAGRKIDGKPMAIMFDEGWKGLQDELLAKQILNWEKTIRKEEGLIVFGSNSPDDCGESYIGKQIIEQSPTKIFTPNPKATKEIYCDLFTLNQRELMLIKTLPKNSRKFLVKTPTESVVLTLDLSPLGEYLHVLSGRKKTVLLLDEIRAKVGDDPKDWMHIFLQRAGSI